ncbi:MAG: hypothetical protein K9M98_06765 [Cephaloticoccus sp.]|nr:hypothetical protein [Cephaloticoccus sp.]MCF7760190.1 hypothetical protein [Cephaloticoccus sp.]
MNPKLSALFLITSALWLTGCQTSTARLNTESLTVAAVNTTPVETFGGKIGLQLPAAERSAALPTPKRDTRLFTLDDKAYQAWKRANRS